MRRVTSAPDTARAVSPDSGEHWTVEGAWRVAEGVHRIPLPLPMDGLRAVNVYTLETEHGLVLVDGGWAIEEARTLLEKSLATIGFSFSDIRRFLVTHVHRDHYTLARVLGTEYGADVALGIGDKPTLDLVNNVEDLDGDPTVQVLRSAGAADLAEKWAAFDRQPPEPALWAYPDTWLEGDHRISLGSRTLDAVHTPGHTQGHYVFADSADGMLFAGDHVLPTITPSIGFEPRPARQPLGDFMASLAKVRGLPDLTLLPAHGPLAPSTHTRVDELLAHHEHRLALCRASLDSGSATAHDVAGDLPWTRHEHAFASLDLFNAALASLETQAHLELLVARGQVEREVRDDDAVVFTAASAGAGSRPPGTPAH